MSVNALLGWEGACLLDRSKGTFFTKRVNIQLRSTPDFKATTGRYYQISASIWRIIHLAFLHRGHPEEYGDGKSALHATSSQQVGKGSGVVIR